MFIASGVKADGKMVESDTVYMEVDGNLYEINPKSLHVDHVSDRLDNMDFLADADATINGDRQNEYGKPERNFHVIANFWKNYLKGTGRQDLDITTEDVGCMMALLKIARISTGYSKRDSYIDAIGYLALSGEIYEAEKEAEADACANTEASEEGEDGH
jgi:hypothetical protein